METFVDRWPAQAETVAVKLPRRRCSKAPGLGTAAAAAAPASSTVRWAGRAAHAGQAWELQGTTRAAAVAAAAACSTALIRWRGMASLAVRVACLLLRLGCQDFVRDVAVHMAASGEAAGLGVMCVVARRGGGERLVHQLFPSLLTQQHVAAAAAVAEAFWHVAAATGMLPFSAARLLAPSVVAAVDCGHVGAVAALLRRLFSAHMQPLLMWLLEAVVRDAERADAAAAVAWAAVQQGGAEMVSDLWALLTVDGQTATAAALAQALFDHDPVPDSRQQVAEVLAAGAMQAVEAGRAAEAVAVHWIVFEAGRLDVLAAVVAALTWQDPSGAHCAGVLACHAITSGRQQLVAATCRQLLLSGRAAEAAALLAELYAGGHPHLVSRVAAAAVVDAVDGGGAAAVAAANMLLWRRGAVPLLCDFQLAAMHEGWADAVAETAWQALQQGGGEMVAGVMAAIIGRGGSEQAAALALQLASVSDGSPLVVQVIARAMAAAVRAGSEAQAAAVAALLMNGGGGELHRDVSAYLADAGHEEDLGC